MVAALALGAAPMANPRPQIANAFFEQPSQGFDFPVTGESQAIRTYPSLAVRARNGGVADNSGVDAW